MTYNWQPYAVGGATRPDSFTSMTPRMQQGLWGLLTSADSELGKGLQVYSGYRSPELQASLWENALKKYGSPEKARKWVAPPGRSRHNTGQAADLKWNGTRIDKLPENHPARVWLAENVSRFGLAQPMAWEPWQVEVAGARGQSFGSQKMQMPANVPASEPQGAPFQYGSTLPGIFEEPEAPGVLQALAQTISAQQTPPPAPVAPQIMPMQAQPYQPTRRDTSQPYLQLFQGLMG